MTARTIIAREKIAQLRGSFIAKLPDLLARGRQLHDILFQSGPAGPAPALDVAKELHRLLHSLKGTGATLGLVALSEHAERGETIAVQIAEDPALATAASGTELMACLEALDQEARALNTNASAAAGDVEQHGTPAFELTSRPNAKAKPEGDEGPRLIYLCDDDKVQVEHLSAQLQCFGYRTVTFTEPQALQAATAAKRPHAIIMDIIFPNGDTTGTDTVLAINQNLAERVPTVFISARSDFDARLRAVHAGGSAYFPKPIDVMALVTRLDALTIRIEPEPYRILIVDDEDEVAAYHSHILQSAGMTTRILHNHQAVLTELDDFHPDLVLMDMYMPQCTGPDLGKLIRQMPSWVSLPIIFLSSETNKAKQFSAMSIGAEGFLTKPVPPADLVAAVSLRSERMRDLRSLMVRDSLTGLFNHTTTTQMLANNLSAANRRNLTLGLAMIDLDRFKSVNDTYGHIIGDQVLVALARILRERLRKSDIIGRYGGEEFAVIMRDVSLDEAIHTIDKVRAAFNQVRFHHNGKDFHCSFSAGVAVSAREKTLIALRAEADRALYQAKHNGRNQVTALHN